MTDWTSRRPIVQPRTNSWLCDYCMGVSARPPTTGGDEVQCSQRCDYCRTPILAGMKAARR